MKNIFGFFFWVFILFVVYDENHEIVYQTDLGSDVTNVCVCSAGESEDSGCTEMVVIPANVPGYEEGDCILIWTKEK